MQRMRTNVAEEAIQSYLRAGRFRTSYFEHASSHTEPDVRRDDFGAGYPLSKLAALSGSEFCSRSVVARVLLVDGTDLLAGAVG